MEYIRGLMLEAFGGECIKTGDKNVSILLNHYVDQYVDYNGNIENLQNERL